MSQKLVTAQIVCAMLLLATGWDSPAEALQTEPEAMTQAAAANKAKDYATSLAIYRRLSDQGSAAAPAMIGLLYFAGAGVPRDHTQACDFFAVSEQRSDPNGTELLADCFYKGEGRAQDYAQSALLYGKASARGVPIADCALGNQYLRGQGVAKVSNAITSKPQKSGICQRNAATAPRRHVWRSIILRHPLIQRISE